jgi:formate hydrogenlyase transcriptional activator
LRVPMGEFKTPVDPSQGDLLTMQAAEREHILKALEASHWKLAGPTGAASRLGMKRTTLQSRMKKLGISRSR